MIRLEGWSHQLFIIPIQPVSAFPLVQTVWPFSFTPPLSSMPDMPFARRSNMPLPRLPRHIPRRSLAGGPYFRRLIGQGLSYIVGDSSGQAAWCKRQAEGRHPNAKPNAPECPAAASCTYPRRLRRLAIARHMSAARLYRCPGACAQFWTE